MKRVLLMCVLAIAVGFPVTVRAASPKTLVYTGALKDEKGSPVGGIYWFRYALHRGQAEKKMLWSEEMYVAVDKGSYQVELGKERPIPQALDLTKLTLSVAIDGVEVKRLPVDDTMISGGGKAAAMGIPADFKGVCKKCTNADKANDSEKIGGMSVKQLVSTLAKKQIEVGTTAHFTSAVGSGEGTSFRLTCPPGFVVTGIKGKADDTIANLQLVCSPLESK